MTQAATKPRRQRSDAAIPDVAQAGMDDMIIVNAGLEADIETYLLHREAAKLANAAHARIKSVIKANDYDAGRYQVGSHIINVGDWSGGERIMPASESKTFKILR